MINLTKQQKDEFLISYFSSFSNSKTGIYITKEKGNVSIQFPIEIGKEDSIMESIKKNLLVAYNKYIIEIINTNEKEINKNLIFESLLTPGKLSFSWY